MRVVSFLYQKKKRKYVEGSASFLNDHLFRYFSFYMYISLSSSDPDVMSNTFFLNRVFSCKFSFSLYVLITYLSIFWCASFPSAPSIEFNFNLDLYLNLLYVAWLSERITDVIERIFFFLLYIKKT